MIPYMSSWYTLYNFFFSVNLPHKLSLVLADVKDLSLYSLNNQCLVFGENPEGFFLAWERQGG